MIQTIRNVCCLIGSVGIVSALIFNLSCNPTTAQPTVNANSSLQPEKAEISSNLHFFYLENYRGEGHNQLELLRDKVYKKNKKKKLVFTYFHDSSNQITLAAWASLRAKKDDQFNTDFEKLHIRSEVGLDLTGKNLPLANFEIRNQGKGKKYLDVLFNDTVVNVPKYKYIVFEPFDSSNAVFYKIRYTDDFTGKALKALPAMNLQVNPSPPKDAY